MAGIEASEHIEKIQFKPGEFIFFEGDIESHFYIIEEGVVQIFTKNREGKRLTICDIHAGESFGEFALLENKPRSASAQAITDVSLVKVSAAGYEQLLSELPTWAISMLTVFADRLKRMTAQMKNLEQFVPRTPRS